MASPNRTPLAVESAPKAAAAEIVVAAAKDQPHPEAAVQVPDDLSPLSQPPFDTALGDLEKLLTQSSRAFLLGAGCSKCAGLPLTLELTEKTLNDPNLSPTTKDILSAITTHFEGAKDGNIEDYLSELIDLLAIAERRLQRGATNSKVELAEKFYDPQNLQETLDEIKAVIARFVGATEIEISIHWRFVRAIHRAIRPGMAIASHPVDYLILNYDSLIEDALALEKVRYSDGIYGGSTGWFDAASFEQEALLARVFKLHGSINWCELEGETLPRRIMSNVSLPKNAQKRVLIWPASTKYRETQHDPYAQVMAVARKTLKPENQLVLTICGYRFADSHINSEIERGLRESGKRLNVVVFSADEQPLGELKRWTEDAAISDQVRVYARRGFFHGSARHTSDADLPWWKFENVTRLLEGQR